MKLPTASLLILLSASSSSAFAPATKAFVTTRNDLTTASSRRSQNKYNWSLPSTTVKKGEIDTSEVVSSADSNAKDANVHHVFAETTDQARAAALSYMKQYEGQSGAAAVYSKLLENGVTVVNGYSGGAVLPLLDQFHEEHPRHSMPGAKKPIRWITNSNEQNAGHVTEGIAKASPINDEQLPVGVCVATSGPGVTNLITPLQDAMCDGVPMVVLCGQAATTAPEDAFQSAPAVAMTQPCTKWSYQIKNAAEIPLVLDYAFYVARNGRPGPVFVDLPKDLQNQVIDENLINDFIQTSFADKSTDGFARIAERRKEDGSTFHALHFGDEKKGLAFTIAKSHDRLSLTHVKNYGQSDMYDADHNPRNRIYHLDDNNGEDNMITREGELKPGSSLLKDVVNLIRKAKKPILLAGQGCNDCPEDLKKLAETLRIPVTTTLHALGVFDERHELALNMMGMHGHPTPNFLVQDSDLIICVGSRFDDRITGKMSEFIPEARKAAEEGRGGVIHVDIRLTEKSKQVQPTYFVHSTAKTFLQTVNTALEAYENPRIMTAEWIKKMKDLKTKYPIGIPKFPTKHITVTDDAGESHIVNRTPLSAQKVVQEMNLQLLKAGQMDNCIFTTGVGIHQMVAAQLITWTQPRQMLSSGSLGTMGVSLGFCIGAKLAQEDKICISVDGDGSFNMTFTELKTLMEQNIPIKILLLDNESQMMVEYWQRLFHEKRYLAVRNVNPKYTVLADAFGIKNLYVDCEEELDAKMKEFLFECQDEPVLFHVKTERTPCLPLVAPGQRLENMILEDEDFEVDPAAAPS